MTFQLLTNSEGKKMGKTEKGAVWLDPEKTSPYDFFQYWRNIPDADVIKCMKMLTFLPLDEIKQYESLTGQELNPVKEKLAYEVTALVHGEAEAIKCLEAARAVFAGGGLSGDMPTTTLTDSDFVDGSITLIDLMLKGKLAPSKGEARRLIQQGGVSVDDVKADKFDLSFAAEAFDGDGVVVKKGKKVYHRFTK